MRDKQVAMSTLLSTKDAARLLGVSEASVRRWSDDGLIQVQRLGPRQERRFKESDVLAYREGGRRLAGGVVDASEAASLLVAGLPVTLGTHLASFYETDRGREAISVPFLADGILARDHCLLFAPDKMIATYRLALARDGGREFEEAVREGRFTTASWPGSSAPEALAYLEGHVRTLSADGPVVIRIVAEMASIATGFVSVDDMITYEHMLGSFAKRFPTVFLCQYDAREFDGVSIVRAMKAHPDIFDFRVERLLS
jgi:excisionase family DNA binding protein